MPRKAYVGLDDKSRKMTSCFIGVNGVARKVVKGYIGDENGIARLWYCMRKQLGEYNVGESVFLNINGIPTEFLVVHHGIPSGSVVYDSSCDGTWLFMKNIYGHKAWNSSSANNYSKSTIHTYLNGTFLGLFDTDVQNAIKQVKIPYGVYNPNDSITATVNSGANGLSTKIFLPSTGECGHDHVGYDYQAYDGENLEYFVDTNSTGDDSKRIAYFNGEVSRWWSRTCRGGSQGSAYYVDTTGRFSYESVTSSHGGLRPMLIMPPETVFDSWKNTFLAAE